MTWTDAQLFALDPPMSRSDTFRFDVIDNQDTLIGTVQPRMDAPPTISWSASSSTERTMSGFSLGLADTAALNAAANRIKVTAILENGSEFPLGLFTFTDAPKARTTAGLALTGASLGDMWTPINTPSIYGYSWPASTRIVNVIRDVFQNTLGWNYPAGLTDPGSTLLTAMPAPPGTDQGGIIRNVLTLLGYVGYFDNNGNWAMRPTPSAGSPPTLFYAEGGTIIDGTIIESDSALSAPNVFIVIDNSAQAPTVGVYKAPTSALVSQRWYSVGTVVTQQGLGSQGAADNAAAALATSDVAGFQQVEFDAAPDFRHDSYDLVSYQGETFLEVGWVLSCTSGGPMHHSLRKLLSA